MEKVRIITDSASDLSPDIIEKYGIQVVGLDVIFGEERFEEGRGMDNKTFYERMKKEAELPKTSCPSPDKFANIYGKSDTDAVVLNISSNLSGTYNSALVAKGIYEENGGKADIRVIDTLSGSVEEGLFVIYAARLAESGKSAYEIEKTILKHVNKTPYFGALRTLENAIKGGRISKLAGNIINTFNFKALIKVEGGSVYPFDKARGEANSVKKLVNKFIEQQENTEERSVVVGHTNCPEKAELVKELLMEKADFKEIIILEIGPIMGTYCSEGSVLIGAIETKID